MRQHKWTRLVYTLFFLLFCLSFFLYPGLISFLPNGFVEHSHMLLAALGRGRAGCCFGILCWHFFFRYLFQGLLAQLVDWLRAFFIFIFLRHICLINTSAWLICRHAQRKRKTIAKNHTCCSARKINKMFLLNRYRNNDNNFGYDKLLMSLINAAQ